MKRLFLGIASAFSAGLLVAGVWGPLIGSAAAAAAGKLGSVKKLTPYKTAIVNGKGHLPAKGAFSGDLLDFVTLTNENPIDVKINTNFVKQAEYYGFKVNSFYSTFNAAQTASNMQQAIAQHPVAIGIVPSTGHALIPQLLDAKAAGIPTFLIDTQVTPASDTGDYTAASLTNQITGYGVNAAKLMGAVLNSEGRHGGNVLFINGPPGLLSSKQEIEGFKKGLKKYYPDVKVLDVATGAYTESKSETTAGKLYAEYTGKFVGVATSVDQMTVGAVIAAKDAGLKPGTAKGDIVFVSEGCGPGGITYVESGTIYGDVSSNDKWLADTSVNELAEYLKGKEVPKILYTHNKRFTTGHVTATDKAACTY